MIPKVSILIATYNRTGLLHNAIESVLAQTYSDYELIVVDDGSSDGTRSVVQSYIDRATSFSNRVRYVYQEHEGKSVALNRGLALARGQWIAFLDSDDVWEPNKLEMQFEAIAQFPECETCFTDCRFSGNAKMDTTFFRHFGWSCRTRLGKIEDPAEFVLRFPCASIITVLFRADLLKKAGGFDPILRFTEDYDFVFRLGLQTQFCFVNLPLATADRSEG